MVLQIAAALLVAIALAHSLLGERYILRRLFRRGELPRLYGSDRFTRRTLRFAWHLTSVAWLGFAALLVVQSPRPEPDGALLAVVTATFLAHAVITAVASRGKHFAWPVFLAIAVLCWLAA